MTKLKACCSAAVMAAIGLVSASALASIPAPACGGDKSVKKPDDTKHPNPSALCGGDKSVKKPDDTKHPNPSLN